ncbi:MAG TPA: hypothetical protein PLA01_02650 [Acetivibrio sp.]|nr:hypothetical protein [Acetivibrio sp.]
MKLLKSDGGSMPPELLLSRISRSEITKKRWGFNTPGAFVKWDFPKSKERKVLAF